MRSGYRENVFERSGLASLADLQSDVFHTIFASLEGDQEVFLSRRAEIISRDYKWPSDPLHTWSRVWEYPFVYYNLNKWRSRYDGSGAPRVVDLGCGVTFFPFSISRMGFNVICADIDPICQEGITKAERCIKHDPGRVEFRLIKDAILPFADGEADAVYCISVIEHIPTFEDTIAEIVRILKPGGMLILTVDIDLRGDFELGVESYRRLRVSLARNFEYFHPEVIIHPADMLHSGTGPYALERPRGYKLLKHILVQHMIKSLLGMQPHDFHPFHLAVQGFVMVKK